MHIGQNYACRNSNFHTSMLVRSIGIRMMNTIQRMTETGRYAISDSESVRPEGSSRKIWSKLSSPVVIVIVFSRDRGRSENGERYIYEDYNNYNESTVYAQWLIHTFRTCTKLPHALVWPHTPLINNKNLIYYS